VSASETMITRSSVTPKVTTKLVSYVCSAIAIILAALQAYGNRDLIYQTDGISYLDISDFIMLGHWHEVVSSHWSPLYPMILAVVRSLSHADNFGEPAAVKFTNFFLYLILLAAFNIFLNAFLDFQKSLRKSSIENIPLPIVAFCMYCWFWWSSLAVTGVFVDTPDQMSAAAILIASSIILRIKTSSINLQRLVSLGSVLGLGYLAKSATLPIALVDFAIIFFLSRTNRVKNSCLSLACFLIFAGPWIASISNKVGHFTFSDSAQLNYRIFIERATYQYRPRAPLFPKAPRIICIKPNTFEFATPIGGTYPLWTDPIYWHQGPPPRLSISVLREMAANAIYYFVLFGLPLSCSLFQYVVNRPVSFSLRALQATWILWLPAFAGLAMYAPVITIMLGSGRYIASFVILLAASTIASLALQKGNKASLSLILLILITYPLLDLFGEVTTDVKLAMKVPSYRSWHIAQELLRRGVQPGSRVAVLGSEQKQGSYRCAPMAPPLVNEQQAWYYWARLAGARVVAQITLDDCKDASLLNQEDYLKASPAERAELYRKLKSLGVKAIVYNPANRTDLLSAGCRQNDADLLEYAPSGIREDLPTGWSELDDLQCYVYMIK
jgi:hypothetical protein